MPLSTTRLGLVLGLATLAISAVIPDVCNRVCKPDNAICLSACGYNISHLPPPFFGAPWVRLSARFDMGVLDEQVSGCSAPLNSEKTNIYFTTLQGRLYQYNNQTNDFGALLDLSQYFGLDQNVSKGLYDVSFHRQFEQNGHFYVHFSVPAKRGTVLTVSSDVRTPGTQQAYQLVVDHYNVVHKFRLLGNIAIPLNEVKRYPQVSTARSGGWMSAAMREGWNWYSEDPLYLAIGGNADENILYGAELSYLSSIRRMDANKPDETDAIWANGIGNPISCSTTIFKSGEIMCLVQLEGGDRALYRIKKGTNSGRPEFVKLCQSHACAQQKARLDTAPLEVFKKDARCPVTSVLHYTGYKMNKFRTNLFLSRDSCFDAKTGAFRPAELLRLVKNSTTAEWYTHTLPSDFEDNFLVETKLIGADKHNDFFLSGYSMRSKKRVFYSIDPIRAANDFYEEEFNEEGLKTERRKRR